MSIPKVLCACLLTLSLAGAANAAPLYVWGGSIDTGAAQDVNKTSVNGPPDSFLCWAAAAADALAWTGWRGWNSVSSTYIDTASGIYSLIRSSWPNTEGSPTYAYEWWMTGRTESIIEQPPGSGNTAKVFPGAGLDFYPTVHVQDGDPNSVTAFVKDSSAFPTTIYDYLGAYIGAQRAIVASIDVPSGPGILGAYSHSLTVWGWDSDAHELYITDSDDGSPGIRTVTFYQDTDGHVYIDNYTNLYTTATDALITQLTRLNRNIDGIEPDHGNGGGDGEVVPEPASILLLGTGLSGLLVARRKARKR